MNANKPDLMALSVDDARKEKWRMGREQYGPTFVGHPLRELHDELLDAANYCEEASKWGYNLGSMPEFIRVFTVRVREALKRQHGERPNGS